MRADAPFYAGTLKAQGQADQEISYCETTHGPVVGYATVGGKRVAISLERSTRGRELLSTQAFYDLDTRRVTSAKDFVATMNGVEFSFNWFYADDRDIALLLERAPADPRAAERIRRCRRSAPATTSGAASCRSPAHPQAINPRSGVIVNWNNKPAPSVGAADDNWSYGSVQRVDLLRAAVASRKKHTLATLVGRDEQGGDAGPARRRGSGR